MAQSIATSEGTLAGGFRLKFIIGGVLILAAIAYLIFVATKNEGQYFYTIEELKDSGAAAVGDNVRVSGAVIGESIQYDAQKLELRFTVANVPADQKEIDAQGGLAAVLAAAVRSPNAARMDVIYNGVRPDLMKGEAQAIMDGRIDENGLFHADTLLMKCPTRYEGDIPVQAEP